jgi:hypothetical protein
MTPLQQQQVLLGLGFMVRWGGFFWWTTIRNVLTLLCSKAVLRTTNWATTRVARAANPKNSLGGFRPSRISNPRRVSVRHNSDGTGHTVWSELSSDCKHTQCSNAARSAAKPEHGTGRQLATPRPTSRRSFWAKCRCEQVSFGRWTTRRLDISSGVDGNVAASTLSKGWLDVPGLRRVDTVWS